MSIGAVPSLVLHVCNSGVVRVGAARLFVTEMAGYSLLHYIRYLCPRPHLDVQRKLSHLWQKREQEQLVRVSLHVPRYFYIVEHRHLDFILGRFTVRAGLFDAFLSLRLFCGTGLCMFFEEIDVDYCGVITANKGHCMI
ncbi:unnamed protein product [Parnassius mnemosyne]|uniref:Uncharacterized protein n=1 Tax=Parnassius mnemosyne TaxID=213953 RepID=A0AAV1L3W2_9NEOP